jgi:enediyne biosynthesis protein E4
VQFQEVRSGASYLSQNDMRLHFGLGSQRIMKTVEVYWPSGKTEGYQNLGADHVYTIVEGDGIKQSASFDVRNKAESAAAGKKSK